MGEIIQGDCIEVMEGLETDSIDAMITDPPYGYSFMGKDWDKAVPSVDIWKECLRILKPGAFACVMSAPRSDVQMHMIQNLTEAGFRLDFTPIYWTYASGFPKAGNIAKMVDKRNGVEFETKPAEGVGFMNDNPDGYNTTKNQMIRTGEMSAQAKALDGSYAGFQPKPAVEVIIVAMKPLSEKTFVDQALKNGKGISWLDDCRIPTAEALERVSGGSVNAIGQWGLKAKHTTPQHEQGRFPANLLVSDDVLNDGTVTKSTGGVNTNGHHGAMRMGRTSGQGGNAGGLGDSGSYSRYFDLDKWASTLPFLIVPKASKGEKDKGLEHLSKKQTGHVASDTGGGGGWAKDSEKNPNLPRANHHPTVKPLKLMSYLVTLFSREGDIVLDPFLGSGTTALAAKKLNRKYIGIELNKEYIEIAQARLDEKQEALF